MSTRTLLVCDGCGLTEETLPISGAHSSLDYCDPCLEEVAKFTSALRALYVQHQEQIAAELKELRAKYALIKTLPVPGPEPL